MLIAVTGSVNSGKTSAIERAASQVGSQANLAGVISKKRMTDGELAGYQAVCLPKGVEHEFARLRNSTDSAVNQEKVSLPGYEAYCRFWINSLTVKKMSTYLLQNMEADILVLDEVGALELAGRGWAKVLPRLSERAKPIILGVRKQFLADILQFFETEAALVDMDAQTQDSGAQAILQALNPSLRGR